MLDADGNDINACWSCDTCIDGAGYHAYPTYCFEPPNEFSPTAYPDCSFTPGDASSCGTGCVYTPASQKCGATVIAGGCEAGSWQTPATGDGCVDQPDMFVDFVTNVTGGGSCQVKPDLDRFCHINFAGSDAAANQAVCEAAGDCEYFRDDAMADSIDTCRSRGVDLCAGAYTDQATCENLYTKKNKIYERYCVSHL